MGGAFLGFATTGAIALIAWLSYHFGRSKEPDVIKSDTEQKQQAVDPAFSTPESGSESAQIDAVLKTGSEPRSPREPSGAEQGQAFQGFQEYQTVNRMSADLTTVVTQTAEPAQSERDQAVGSGAPEVSILPWSNDYAGGPVE